MSVDGTGLLPRSAGGDRPAGPRPSPPSSRAAWLDRRSAAVVLGTVGVVLALGAWELAVVTGVLPEIDMPRASTVIGELAHQVKTHRFWSALWSTVSAAAVGLALASAIGVTLGVLMGTNEYVRRSLRPTTEFLRPVPGFALLPLAIVIWGPARGSDIFLVTFSCTWPMLVQTLNGVQGVDGTALLTARSFGLSRRATIRWVILPGALAFVITGLRLCVGIALVVAIGSEIIGGSPGLGTQIRIAQTQVNLPVMYALIIASGLLGLLAVTVMERIERRVLRWQPKGAR